MNVDLPQPDGPMIAVTFLSRIGSVMPFSTSLWPKKACSSCACILAAALLLIAGLVAELVPNSRRSPSPGSSLVSDPRSAIG